MFKATILCPVCGGTGYGLGVGCDYCGGGGYVPANPAAYCPCPNCGPKPKKSCEYCAGTGEILRSRR